MLENIGTRDIDSTPPMITASICPDITAAAPKCAACWLDPHCRSMLTPVTDSGSPAASAALRATFALCPPTWLTHPQMTSSIASGSTPLRCTSASMAMADRSTGWMSESAPFPGLPIPTGVRTASTITASFMTAPFPRAPYAQSSIDDTQRSNKLLDLRRSQHRHRSDDEQHSTHTRYLNRNAPLLGCMHQNCCHRGTDNEPAEMGPPIDTGGKKTNDDVYAQQHQYLGDVVPQPATSDHQRAHEPEDRATCTHGNRTDVREVVRRHCAA